MSHPNNFYITTPIYYVNDVPHIGHAYTTVAADVLARYWRLRGRDVFFLTGLDEHGQKVQQAAAKAGIDPQAHCDKLAPQFQTLWKRLNISNNAFIRTTDAQHKFIVQRYLDELHAKQLIYKDDYTGWYCTFDERFWTEKDVEGGLCPDCKRPVERISEHNYFFKMGQYQDRLIDHIKQHPNFIRPESRRNEVLGFLTTQKLGDLSISRPKSRLSWGIELPFDKDYVTYVWFDALVNYVSALEYKRTDSLVDRFWPANMHLVGKDILTTHAVYWSTMLMALNLPLPETIFAHGWWTVDGEKMSKSRGNVVDPNKIISDLQEAGAGGAAAVDAFRYFLLREVPFGHDGDFSRNALIGRVNSDLANGLGNLVSRTLTLIEQNTGGLIPSPVTSAETRLEPELRQACQELLNTSLEETLPKLEFNRALEAVWHLVQLANQYVDQSAPWTLVKKPENAPRLHTVLYHMAETLRILGLSLYPFMPDTVNSLNIQLGLSNRFDGPLPSIYWTWGRLEPGMQIRKGRGLFPRILQAASGTLAMAEHAPKLLMSKGDKPVSEPDTSSQSTTKTDAPVAAAVPTPPLPPQITIDEFMKIQLKTAKVISAERVPKSEKLLKLQVAVGTEQRQIVAGIGKKYEPEALIGKTIVIVANLKPAKLMGIESQGMVLAAGDSEVRGLITLLEDVEPGTKVK
jgi:methionyl-tRNA synthetase